MPDYRVTVSGTRDLDLENSIDPRTIESAVVDELDNDGIRLEDIEFDTPSLNVTVDFRGTLLVELTDGDVEEIVADKVRQELGSAVDIEEIDEE